MKKTPLKSLKQSMMMSSKTNKKTFMTDVNFFKNIKSKQYPHIKKKAKNLHKSKLSNMKKSNSKSKPLLTSGKLPRISWPLKRAAKRSKSRKENIGKELKNFVNDFNKEFKNRRKMGHLQMGGNDQQIVNNNKVTCVEKFLNKQQEKAKKNAKNVYERLSKQPEKEVMDFLKRIESKHSFKELLKLKEDELIITKKRFNNLNFQLKKKKQNLSNIKLQVAKWKIELGDYTDQEKISQALSDEKLLNENLEEVRLETESLSHVKKEYMGDILVLKKNEETLKTMLRKWKKVRADLVRKKNMHVKFSNHLLDQILSEKKKKEEMSEVFGGSNNLKSFFHKELDLFKDKVILEEMIRKKDDNGR